MTTTLDYISCACNRLPHTADWGRNGLICYASNHSVAIYNPGVIGFGSVFQTLHGHKDRVSVVKWIRPEFPKKECELISASSDGTAVLWTLTESGSFKTKSTLQIGDPLTICDAIYLSPSKLLVCTSSINGDFRLWLRSENQIKQLQSLAFYKELPIQAQLALLPGKGSARKVPLLMVAVDNSTIQLFVLPNTSSIKDFKESKIESFVKVCTLLGHEDWVTCIDHVIDDNRNLFLASGSQDNTIRLWKLSLVNDKELLNDKILKVKKQKFFAGNQEYEIVLESILSSHEAWIYGVNWNPPVEVNGKISQPMKLLSCSLDKSAILWQPSGSVGIWSESVRVGGVGGNSLGFYECKFGPEGKSFMTHGYQGSFYIWEYREKTTKWVARTAPCGHFDSVVDLCWDPKGRYDNNNSIYNDSNNDDKVIKSTIIFSIFIRIKL